MYRAVATRPLVNDDRQDTTQSAAETGVFNAVTTDSGHVTNRAWHSALLCVWRSQELWNGDVSFLRISVSEIASIMCAIHGILESMRS